MRIHYQKCIVEYFFGYILTGKNLVFSSGHPFFGTRGYATLSVRQVAVLHMIANMYALGPLALECSAWLRECARRRLAPVCLSCTKK